MSSCDRKYTPEAMERGLRKADHFAEFVAENGGRGQAVAYIFSEAEDLYRRGRTISSRGLIESVRSLDFTNDRGMPARPNNDFNGILSRVLLIIRPEYGRLVELRPCVFDVLGDRMQEIAKAVSKVVERWAPKTA